MAGGPLNQDVLNTMPSFAVQGITTPRNITAVLPTPAAPVVPNVPARDQLLQQLQSSGYLAPGVTAASAASRGVPAMPPMSTAPASAQAAATSLPPFQLSAFQMPSTLTGVNSGAAAQAPAENPGGAGMVQRVGTGGRAGAGAGRGMVPQLGAGSAAYDPNADGSWQRYAATQDHTLFDPFGRGDGTVGSGMGAMPGGGAMVGGKFVDPRDAIAYGYQQQLAYQRQSIANLMGAFQRSDGLAATKHALAATIGANNFAGVQGQGVDALNSAIAGITGAGIGANAAMYGADQALAGRIAETTEQHYQAATGSVPTGTVVGSDPVTNMAVPLTTYGQRPASAGMVPTPYNPAPPTAAPKDGATGKTRDGRAVVYRNGAWTVKE
ncbi:hypothetical protein [Burkholderia anthina]|uniref:hypothetical protein n=1 Tax=Burkholderia anthina TaxID=179879 RepID=UPI0037C00705